MADISRSFFSSLLLEFLRGIMSNFRGEEVVCDVP